MATASETTKKRGKKEQKKRVKEPAKLFFLVPMRFKEDLQKRKEKQVINEIRFREKYSFFCTSSLN